MNNETFLTAEQTIQKQLEYYNQRDIEQFMSLFADDVKFYDFYTNELKIDGIAQCREVYGELFAKSPRLHSTILSRIVFENTVIDHERVVGRMDSDELLEVILIFEVKDGKIWKVSVIRK